MPVLKVFDRPYNRVKEFELAGAEFRIGKRTDNHLVLDRFNVSRNHCKIIRQNGSYFLEDCNSTNGTFTDAGKITGRVPLKHGTNIHIGDFTLTFLQQSPADAGQQKVNAQRGETATAPSSTEQKPQPQRKQAAGPEQNIDEHITPVELKKKIHEQLLSDLDLKHNDIAEQSQDVLREKTNAVVRRIVDRLTPEIPHWLRPAELVKEVVDEAVGLGPLEGFLADRTVDEVMVNNWDKIYIERAGRLYKTNKRFTDNNQLMSVIRRILAPIGRRVDESSPMVDARLADGSRVNAIIPPLSLTGPTLTIRKFSYEPFDADDLVEMGTMSPQMAEFLRLAVEHRRNIIITGGTGSGKTTFLNVLSSFISPEERIITIEDAAELKLPQEHVISLESKPPNIEGKGEIGIRKLVINSLRMRPNRIIVGECRGGEALDMLQAMNTGHDGSLTTLHANGAREELPARAIRDQVAAAIDLIVHTARLPDGKRKVMTVSEITGMEGEVITVHGLKQRGIAVNLEIFQ